ncbi:MAG: transglutaminase-like cysteine peptidase [Acidovorax sp.]
MGNALASILRAGPAALLLAAWLLPQLGRGALEFDAARLQQSVRARYGAQGVQALRDWLRLLQEQAGKPPAQQLQAVNDFWNQTVFGSDDPTVWGEADYWATPLESLGKRAGDCEDFVIGKYFSLVRLGVPVEKLRLIYVRARQGGAGSAQSIAHMVLGYYETPAAEPLVLDNLAGDILPASQRRDLTPVFSFNGQGVYVAGAGPSAPVERISRWNGLLARMRQEGFMP